MPGAELPVSLPVSLRALTSREADPGPGPGAWRGSAGQMGSVRTRGFKHPGSTLI